MHFDMLATRNARGLSSLHELRSGFSPLAPFCCLCAIVYNHNTTCIIICIKTYIKAILLISKLCVVLLKDNINTALNLQAQNTEVLKFMQITCINSYTALTSKTPASITLSLSSATVMYMVEMCYRIYEYLLWIFNSVNFI